MKRWRKYLSFTVDAETREEAFRLLLEQLHALTEKDLKEGYLEQQGIIHPDGELRRCGIPPKGYKVWEYGQSYIDGGDWYEAYAVPIDVDAAPFCGNDYRERLQELSDDGTNIFVWDTKGEMWIGVPACPSFNQ